MIGRRVWILLVLATAVVGVGGGLRPSTAATTRATGSPDYNRDGFPDLAVGAPFESVGEASGAGAVHVLYGSSVGICVIGRSTTLMTACGRGTEGW